MDVRQISNEEFDSYSRIEPTSSIFQTTMYGERMADKNKRILCLAAFDEHDLIVGLAMFIIRKEGFLSVKQSAYCPCGYLVNYYDYETLAEFDRAVKEYLKKEKVSTIIIDPQKKTSTSSPTKKERFPTVTKLILSISKLLKIILWYTNAEKYQRIL